MILSEKAAVKTLLKFAKMSFRGKIKENCRRSKG
jgi:hypothetical protein